MTSSGLVAAVDAVNVDTNWADKTGRHNPCWPLYTSGPLYPPV